MRRLEQTLLVMCMVAGSGCDGDPLVHQDDEHTRDVYRAKLEQWTDWALRLPWSTGPILDGDGSACAMEQSGRTWWLAGTTGGAAVRECTIPAGKQLFFPLINYWVSPRPEQVDTEEEMAAFLAFVETYFPARRAATCALTLRIDGHDVLPDLETMDAELFAEVREPFDVVLGADNFLADPTTAGAHHTVSAGHWALLRPLPPGDHVLEFGGARCSAEGAVVFETSATYMLHVEDDD
ncbi:MAG: hypothetical protein IAG13_02285 [Deltaproteobacteria bacterium]|nr:hypothetical protein [Nannocystaceae bacterium]